MNIYLLTQPDAFYIPKLLDRFCDELPADVRVVGAAVLRGEIAAENVRDYLKLLGPTGTVRTGLDFVRHLAMDIVDSLVDTSGVYSVEGAMRKHGIQVSTPDDINDDAFLNALRGLEVDLVISVACPQIVREPLLNLPPKGVINVHGALLPKYRGKLPSFWVLANGEDETGVTVHYMNEKLDDGPILVQKNVPIRSDDTLHSLVLRSKVGYGAPALVEAVQRIREGNPETRDNPESDATYFSFPTSEAIQRFRSNGRRVR